MRVELLGNKNAGGILERLRELTEAGIELHTQVVLCRNLNDGKYLEKTISDLSELYPGVRSLAIVPVGVTKHRKNLDQFPEFDKVYARQLIDEITIKQKYFKEKFDNSFVFLSDEFYLKGEIEFPKSDVYEDFPQTENGIGLSRLFIDEFELIKDTLPLNIPPRKFYIVAGVLGGKVLRPIVQYLKRIKGLTLELIIVENIFFGPRVTVTGLLTGTDLIHGLKEVEPGAQVIISDILLKKDDNVFLDDLTPEEVEKTLNIELILVKNSAIEMVKKIIEGE